MAFDMFLLSQENLACPVVAGDGCEGKAKFRAGPGRSVVPSVLQKKLACQAAREPYVLGLRFSNS